MLAILGLAATVAITAFGYLYSRSFVRRRLAYVDGVHRGLAPLFAAVGAALVATPVTWILPLVGGGTALLFGAGVGLGVAAGAREARRRLPAS
jgi:hypothetical protein